MTPRQATIQPESAPVLLVGPTAVGKTAVALVLARRLRAEIVSADSMQVYRGMDIGTAKPTPAERRRVHHHLIDLLDAGDSFNVKRFVDLANSAVADIQCRGRSVLVVGGTGLYVRALRRGLFEGPSRDPALRARLEEKPVDELFAELQRVDPVSSKRIDRHNRRRLVRALEVIHLTGRPIVEQQTQWSEVGSALEEGPAFCLDRDREDLYQRIEQRIDQQIATGWLEEVRRLQQRGLERNPTAMQAAGYRELLAHLRGEIPLDEAVRLVKTRTRQLARRQLTWFRREPNLLWIRLERNEEPDAVADRIIDALRVSRNPQRSPGTRF